MRIEVPEDAQARFGREVVIAKHDLPDHPFFTDAALTALLDRFPRHLLYAITMGNDPEREENQLVDHRAASGAQLLEAVRRGRLWLNITSVDSADEGYRALLGELRAQLTAQIPGLQPDGMRATLLVSSPRAMVYFHADGPPSVLWHIRGAKRVSVWPALDERFLPRPTLEDIFRGSAPEYVPFKNAFDEHATAFDMEPGQFAAWPQNAPHRVTNLDSINVSLSTEYFTRASRKRARAYAANSFFRRRFGVQLPPAISGPTALAKVVLHKVAKKLGMDPDPSRGKRRIPTLRIAADAPNGVAELSPEGSS